MACPGKNIKFSKDFSLLNQMFIVKKGVFWIFEIFKSGVGKVQMQRTETARNLDFSLKSKNLSFILVKKLIFTLTAPLKDP